MNQSTPLLTYIQEWMDTFKRYSVKQSTYDRLVTSVHALEGYAIATMPVGEITAFHIQRYVNELADSGYGLSTIKKQMRIVTSPLKYAAALHWLPSDPAVGIKLPKQDYVQKQSHAVDAYNADEQEALQKVLDTDARPGYAAIALMIETGLRAGEVLALRWRDINLLRKRLNVNATVVRLANKKQSYVQDSTKSESSKRVIPLTPRAIQLLTSLQKKKTNEWVFNNVDGERLSYEALRWQTRHACQEAGVDYRGEHVFRHTFATNCYYRGVDVKVLSKLLGHADVNITYNIYVHLYGDGFDELYAALVP